MADFDRLTVTPEELDAQASIVESKLNAVKEFFEDVKALFNGTEYYWIGAAGDAHRESYLSRTEVIETMLLRYQEHVDDLRRMAGVYRDAESLAAYVADTLPTSQL